jgi:hypothetical protein
MAQMAQTDEYCDVPEPPRTQGRWRAVLPALQRVVLPAAIAALVAKLLYPLIALDLVPFLNKGTLAIIANDESQFVQNITTTIGLCFSILSGQTYYFMYQQQEAIYYALFDEVSEAKSLLEQMTLVCASRPYYRQAIRYMQDYVRSDLRALDVAPAVLLSQRPADDPLESIMLLTSVGVPGVVYETVRTLRQARSRRLGAIQRKFPSLGIYLLYAIAVCLLLTFPILGTGLTTVDAAVLGPQAWLFALMVFAVFLILLVITDLWKMDGGKLTRTREVLDTMVEGLEEELDDRLCGKQFSSVLLGETGEVGSLYARPDVSIDRINQFDNSRKPRSQIIDRKLSD